MSIHNNNNNKFLNNVEKADGIKGLANRVKSNDKSVRNNVVMTPGSIKSLIFSQLTSLTTQNTKNDPISNEIVNAKNMNNKSLLSKPKNVQNTENSANQSKQIVGKNHGELKENWGLLNKQSEGNESKDIRLTSLIHDKNQIIQKNLKEGFSNTNNALTMHKKTQQYDDLKKSNLMKNDLSKSDLKKNNLKNNVLNDSLSPNENIRRCRTPSKTIKSSPSPNRKSSPKLLKSANRVDNVNSKISGDKIQKTERTISDKMRISLEDQNNKIEQKEKVFIKTKNSILKQNMGYSNITPPPLSSLSSSPNSLLCTNGIISNTQRQKKSWQMKKPNNKHDEFISKTIIMNEVEEESFGMNIKINSINNDDNRYLESYQDVVLSTTLQTQVNEVSQVEMNDTSCFMNDDGLANSKNTSYETKGMNKLGLINVDTTIPCNYNKQICSKSNIISSQRRGSALINQFNHASCSSSASHNALINDQNVGFKTFAYYATPKKQRQGSSQMKRDLSSRSVSKAYDNSNSQSEFEFRPHLSKKSLDIASKLGDSYHRLIKTPKARINDEKNKKLVGEIERELTFRPHINKKSEILDMNFKLKAFNGDELDRWDQLLLLHDKSKIDRDMKKLEKGKKQLEAEIQYNFTPTLCKTSYQINRENHKDIVERSYNWQKCKEDKLNKERSISTEKQLENCTFNPSVSKDNITYESNIKRSYSTNSIKETKFIVKGIENHLERTDLAKRKKQQKQALDNKITGRNWQYKLTKPQEFQFRCEKGSLHLSQSSIYNINRNNKIIINGNNINKSVNSFFASSNIQDNIQYKNSSGLNQIITLLHSELHKLDL